MFKRGPQNEERRTRMQTFKKMGEWLIGRLGCRLTGLLGSRTRQSVGILTYHRIAPWREATPPPTWNVTPERFRQQLTGLLARGYQAWPLKTVLNFHRAGIAIPSRTFVVTFDDGYENLYHQAWPVLCELGVPATVFLATAYLDSDAPFPFDDWSAAGSPDVAVEAWKPLTSAQCREMLEHGLIELGCHTHTHAVYRGRPEVLAQELVISQEMLHTHFGVTEATFSFPYGITGPDLIAAARRAGVLCGLTTEPVLVRPHMDPFHWGRFGVDESDSASMLVCKLEGWYSLARSVWLQMRGPVVSDDESTSRNLVYRSMETT